MSQGRGESSNVQVKCEDELTGSRHPTTWTLVDPLAWLSSTNRQVWVDYRLYYSQALLLALLLCHSHEFLKLAACVTLAPFPTSCMLFW